MLRIYFWAVFSVMICTIRLSNAANCTLLSFSQDVNAAQLSASKTNLADFAVLFQDQITAKYTELFNESLASINFTTTQNPSSNNIGFSLLTACSQTTTTVSADGKTTTTEVASKVNKTAVQQVISCGLF
jgi:hypothetical protein